METRRMFFSRRNILKGSAASLAAAALGSSSPNSQNISPGFFHFEKNLS